MKILVTGGAGYIGSHTCLDLLKEGHEVVIVDNFSNSHPEAVRRIEKISLKKVKLYKTDILDIEGMEKIFMENDFDAVIHFAGLKAVGESVKLPLKYYKTNVTGTIILAQLMEKYNVKKLVFSSSATVYGVPKSVPVSEDAALFAVNPYGGTKLMCEEILTDWQRANPDFSVVLLRYFNPVGSHETGLLGEDPSDTPNNLMPYVVRVALGKYKELSVYGGDYDTPDGTGVRDYIHVLDLSLGHVKALKWLENNKGVGIFNLGTGVGYSVLEIVSAFEKSTGKKVPYKIVGRRAGDAATSYGDPSKAKKDLDWEAKLGLEEMCRDSYRFVEINPDGFSGK